MGPKISPHKRGAERLPTLRNGRGRSVPPVLTLRGCSLTSLRVSGRRRARARGWQAPFLPHWKTWHTAWKGTTLAANALGRVSTCRTVQNCCPTEKVTAMDESLRAWSDILAGYREPSSARSILEIVITVLPLVLLWVLMWASLDIGYWLCLLLSVPAAGFLVRLFMIQHDCGHGAFFRQRVVNDWVGRVIGVVTLTPYDFWRRAHAIHHAGSGNLDRRGIGDIDMLTVREYLALPRWRRLLYRLYRHPLVMFGIGPVYEFVLRQRLPLGLMRGGWQPWASTMATNVGDRDPCRAADLAGGRRPVPARAPADHVSRSCDRRLAVLRPAPVRRHLLGSQTRTGIFTRRRCTGARITTCRACCAGSPPISACITSIICAAESRITGCRRCCGITRNLPPSAASRCWKA